VEDAPGAPPIEAREGHELHRGDSIAAYRGMVSAAPGIDTPKLLEGFLAIGIRVSLERDGDTISHLAYIHPYPRKVCGIWLGASASEVQGILGIAEDETSMAQGRRFWIYDVEGHLGVGFDDTDRVNVISR
jgi:hypothetical protein